MGSTTKITFKAILVYYNLEIQASLGYLEYITYQVEKGIVLQNAYLPSPFISFVLVVPHDTNNDTVWHIRINCATLIHSTNDNHKTGCTNLICRIFSVGDFGLQVSTTRALYEFYSMRLASSKTFP